MLSDLIDESPVLVMGLFLWYLYPVDRLIQKLEHLIRVSQPGILMKRIIKGDGLDELIINLNTGGPNDALPTSQLWHGINSRGVTLESIGGPYAASTIEGTSNFPGKKQLGLPFDRITLYNSGEFYQSFKVTVGASGDISITADPNKEDTNLIDEWGKDIIGLTAENIDILIKEFRPKLINYIRDEYQRG